MDFPKFERGKPIPAADLNWLVQRVVQLLNITSDGSVSVVKQSNGVSLRIDQTDLIRTGHVDDSTAMKYQHKGKVYLTDIDPSIVLDPADDTQTFTDAAVGDDNWVWAIPLGVDSGYQIPASGQVLLVFIGRFWRAIPMQCPELIP